MLLRLLVLLGLFIAELAEIHQPANRRRGARRDFHEVHAISAGLVERIAQGDDAELLAVHSDDSNFAGTDFPVYPDKRSGRRRSAWRERAAQDTLVGLNLF